MPAIYRPRFDWRIDWEGMNSSAVDIQVWDLKLGRMVYSSCVDVYRTDPVDEAMAVATRMERANFVSWRAGGKPPKAQSSASITKRLKRISRRSRR